MKNVADIYALTALQERMLTRALAGGEKELVEQFCCELHGPLDPARLRAAAAAVFRRHPLLRTSFAWEGLSRPVQVVRREVDPCWAELDLRGTAASQRQQQVGAFLAKEQSRGFDLTKAPLSRFHLLRTSADSWHFAWTCHHLVVDGWSLAVVMRDLFRIYDRLQHQAPPQLEPPGSFRDYLTWLSDRDAAAAEQFWSGHLGAVHCPTSLPVEWNRAESCSESGQAEYQLALSAEESEQLVRAARAHRVGLSTLVEAAWVLLLAHYAESTDVILGLAVSGRPSELPGVESIVGPLMNNVPLRVGFQWHDTVPLLLTRLRQLHADIQPFEYCSLDQIAAAIGTPKGKRLFNALFVFENYPLGDAANPRVGDVSVCNARGTTSTAYPLCLVGMPGARLALRLVYDRRRYAHETAQRLLHQVARLLGQMAGNFTAKLGELALIQEQDEARLAVQSGKPGPRVHDMAGRLAPPGLPGEIWTITAHAATGGGLRPTGYRGVRHADGAIECLGRKDAPARIGGYSVDPAEVAAVLRLHPLVVESAVVTQAPQGEPQLAAFVVPSADAATAITARGHGLLLEQLRRFVSDRLPEPMVPRAWRILDALPRDACGAIEVHRLPPACRARPAAAGQYHPPGDALEERLCGIWSEILGIDPVGTSDRFFDLGGDSTLVVALAARLEAEFGRRLPLARMLGQPTVKRLADCLRRRPNGAEQVLVPIRPSGTRPPLFCVHPAGGTLFCYLELAAHLQTEIPLYGLQAQGIDGELEPHDSVEAMAAAYAPALKKIQPGGPYQLCGWSTGGLIAFELARQLQAAGDEVSRLILFDAAIPRPGETFDENDLAALLGLLFPDEHPQRIEHPRQLPLEEQLVEFQRRSQRAQLLLSDASSSQVQRIYEVFQANMKAVVSYLPSAFPGRLTLIRATQRATPMHDDPLLGWGPWAAGGIEVYEVPCGHLTMFQQPAVRQVAEILEKCLTERGGQSDRRRAVVAG